MNTKIAVIGGGSYTWAFGFSRQFVMSEHLRGATLTLTDINASALELVSAAAQRFNAAHDSPLRIETTANLEVALNGADYVIVSISTGGFDAMRHDLAIPERYGILHTVGDTVGPGGWLRAVRNIPVFYDLSERMSRLCPQAWMLNVTNPLTPLTRVPQRDFGIKAVGLCSGVEHSVRALARLAGAAPDSRMDYTVTGIDHGSWYTRLFADGMDVLSRLREFGYCRSDDRLPSQLSTDDPLAESAGLRAGFAIWRELGYLPSIADRHTTENWPWFLAGQTGELPFGITRTTIEERIVWQADKRESLERYAAGDDDALGQQGHGDDPVVTVVEALSGSRSFLYGSNYANVGQIPGLPEGAVVETRCLFDAAGVHPVCSPMPDLLKILVLPHVLRQEAIIDIALRGSRDELVALVLTDPLCSHLRVGECRAMVEEMLAATRSWISNARLLEGT